MGIFNRIFGIASTPKAPPELRQLIERSMNGLAAVTAAHDGAWHLGAAAWSLDQDVGDLVFTTPQGMQAVAAAQIIGTYNSQDGTWLWGWDHPSIDPSLAQHAEQVFAFGRQHGYERLTTRKFQCSEEEAWELTALAFLLCEAQGAYRGPAGTSRVFMTFGEVRLSKAV